jgi:hypothetical protein
VTSPRHLVLPLVAVACLATACGSGGSKTAAAATTTTAAGGRGAGLTAFRQCMASHGINLPQRTRPSTVPTTGGSQPPDTGGGGSGGGGGGSGGFGGNRFNQAPAGVDPAKYQAALSACQSQLPTGGGGGAQFRTAITAYVTCLRNHGVTTGDPTLGRQALTGVDRTSATFQAADKTCQALLPARPGGGSTTSTPTTVAS